MATNSSFGIFMLVHLELTSGKVYFAYFFILRKVYFFLSTLRKTGSWEELGASGWALQIHR